jgi:phosphatidylinositol 4-kinase
MCVRWHYGSRKSQALSLYKLLNDFYTATSNDTPNLSYLVTSSPLKDATAAATTTTTPSKIGTGLYMFLNDKTKDDVIRQHHLAKKLLMLFLESELTRLSVWCNPLNATGHGLPAVFSGNTERSLVMEDSWKEMIRFAWEVSPRLAVQMDTRFVLAVVHRELHRLIANNSLDVVDVPEALIILLGDQLMPNAKLDLKVNIAV